MDRVLQSAGRGRSVSVAARPNVELQTPGGPRLRGHDQARDWFEASFENVRPRIVPDRFVSEGNIVVGFGKMEMRYYTKAVKRRAKLSGVYLAEYEKAFASASLAVGEPAEIR
jgi:hypothetical protein